MNTSRRFAEFAAPHLDAVYNLVRWLVGASADAEDVTQDALVRAYRAFDGYRGGDPRAWLLAIARNAAYTMLRARGAKADTVSLEEVMTEDHPGFATFELNPELLFRRTDAIRRINAAVEGLPLPYREVLVLRELEDLSYREIALVLKIPIGTVMSRLSRARAMLAAELEMLREGQT